jgi:hypothetical protein
MGTLMKGGNLNDAAKEMIAPEADQKIAPGLRMAASYGGGSFGLSFHRESVTMACGEAEQALPYSIQRSGAKTMLVIENKPNPLSLQVMSDGSINGSGTVQVNGRIITGTTDDVNNPFTFAPRVASCPIGRLTAGTAITMPASMVSSPSAPPPAPAPHRRPRRANAPPAAVARRSRFCRTRGRETCEQAAGRIEGQLETSRLLAASIVRAP